MFVTRLISGVVLLVLLAFFLFTGNIWLFGMCLALSLMGMFELYRIYGYHKGILGYAGYIAAILYYVAVYMNINVLETGILVMSLIVILGVYVITFPKYKSEEVAICYFAFVYVAVMLSYIYRIRIMENGIYCVWLVFICSWGNDTCAYCVGRLFGKHKMSPKLSPKKSVEGAVGGIAGAALIAAIYGYAFSSRLTTLSNPAAACAIACAAGAFISIFGDLAASAIKRNHDIKDYGRLIPGHGGIMDRFDSVIFTAPIVYYVLTLL